MTDETKLAEMLCTRLCHDLTGPIGAVNNGAEFLAEEGFDMQNEAVKLITSSAHEAVARLQFYRQAYGRVGDHGEASLSDKKALAEDFFSASKIALDWPNAHADGSGVSVSLKASRVLLNFLLLGAQALIRGGTLRVRVSEAEGTKVLQVEAEGDTLKFDADMLAVLRDNQTPALTPKNAPLYLVRALAEELGARISVEADSQRLVFAVHQQSNLAVVSRAVGAE
jgi:histidine phosphotransferase ChpT